MSELTKPQWKLLYNLGNISNTFPYHITERTLYKIIPKFMVVDKIKSHIKTNIQFNRFLIERYLKLLKKL